MDFAHVNFFTTVFPEIVKVKSTVPLTTFAPPSVAEAATERTMEPAAEAVAAVLVFRVIPEGSVPTEQVQAVCVMPTYPVNGIVISRAAVAAPEEEHAMV